MTWFKVDDTLAFHSKTVAAGVAAMGLWVRAGAWSAQTLTDGFIPGHMVGALSDGAPDLAERLVEVGFWRKVRNGYQFHEWDERNPSAKTVKDRRQKETERKAEWRAQKANNATTSRNGHPSPDPVPAGHERPSQGGTQGTPDGTQASVTVGATALSSLPDPTRPDPTRSTNYPPRDSGCAAPVTQHTRDLETLAGSAHSPAAHRLVEDYAAKCARRPPATVLARLAVEIDSLIDQDWPAIDIARALAAWQAKGLDPRALHSVANEVINGPPRDSSGKPTLRLIDTRPVEDIPDAEIDPDAILGPDGWSPVNDEPLEVSELPYEQRSAWLRARSDEHRADRIRQARTALARRQRNRGTA